MNILRFKIIVTLYGKISLPGLGENQIVPTMKKNLSIILCLSFILMNNNCFAQDNTYEVKGLHTVYAEAFGNTFLMYNIGYDYTLKLQEKHKLSFKCGLGYVPRTDEDDRFTFNVFCLLAAPEVSYLYGKKHHLEVGLGATYIADYDPAKGGFYSTNNSNSDNNSFFNLNLELNWLSPIRIGYRYQRDNGGFFFKAAATPLIFWIIKNNTENNEPELSPVLIPWAGVAVGYTFKSR